MWASHGLAADRLGTTGTAPQGSRLKPSFGFSFLRFLRIDAGDSYAKECQRPEDDAKNEPTATTAPFRVCNDCRYERAQKPEAEKYFEHQRLSLAKSAPNIEVCLEVIICSPAWLEDERR